MAIQSPERALIAPARIYAYYDFVQVWLSLPANFAVLCHIAMNCGSGGIHVRNETAEFDPRLRQRIQLRQPNLIALLVLCSLPGVILLNSVEAALDWIFSSEREKSDGHAVYRRASVKRWHRSRHHRLVGDGDKTRYLEKPGSPNNYVDYDDRPCRLTGEEHCSHRERRMVGVKNLRRARVNCVKDLLEIDAREFWEKRLRLYREDKLKLGRALNRVARGNFRRGEWCTYHGRRRWKYSFDRTRANLEMRSCGSIQVLIDRHRNRFDVQKCLVKLDVTHLLPAPGPMIRQDSFPLSPLTGLICLEKRRTGDYAYWLGMRDAASQEMRA